MQKRQRRFSWTEILIILICCLLFLSSFYGLQHIDQYLAERENKTKRPLLGQVVANQNDTRLRTEGSYVWFQTRKNQPVYLGDSVFSGKESSTLVRLDKGGDITVGENSIVVFRRIDNVNLPDLSFGNFNFEVNGSVKVAIAGEITELNGKNSQLQVVIDKNKKAKLKLIAGEATIKTEKSPAQVLKKDSATSLPQIERYSPVNFNEIKFAMTPKQLNHTWKLYDLYDAKNSLELARKPDPSSAFITHRVSWSARQKNQPALLQLSQSEDFANFESYSVADNSFSFERLSLGTNFWRVSLDNGKNWSQPQAVALQAGFMNDAAPKFRKYAENIPFFGKKISFDLDVRSPPETIGYVAEASPSPNFPEGATKTFWKSGSDIQLSFYRTGLYYYRFRTVLKDQTLSNWSTTQKYNVYRPTAPDAPRLASISSRRLYVGETLRAEFETAGISTEILVLNQKNEVVHRAQGRSFEWQPRRSQIYRIVASSENEFGQKSEPSRPALVQVMKAPTLDVAKVKRQERDVSNVEDSLRAESALSLDGLRELRGLNAAYRKSHFSVSGLMWTLQSSEQLNSGANRAVAGGLGLRGLHWLGRTGFEGLAKTQVFATEDSSNSSITSLEGRIHVRRSFNLPISALPQMQVSLFGGMESYKNSGELFSGAYELIKFGTSLAFPLASNWSTGGEVSYGTNANSTTKAEISGYLNRFLSKEWSFGVGYRINFFEAGSSKDAPDGNLPYREGYTEGFSSLYYHF